MHKFRSLTYFFFWLIAAWCSLFYSTCHAAESPVRVFLQENLDGEGKQLALDPKLLALLRYFERGTGLKFELTILPWKRAQIETLDGKGIIYGFSRSPERLKAYHFSFPVVTDRVWGITYGRPKPNYKSVEDLRGKIVSTGRGFSHGLEFEQARDVIFTVQEDSASINARFKKLIAKRSDVMIWPVRGYERSVEVEAYINRIVVDDSNDPELKGKHFDVTDRPLFYDTTHFASAKGAYGDVIGKVDKAIVRGRKDGSLAKILRGYH